MNTTSPALHVGDHDGCQYGDPSASLDVAPDIYTPPSTVTSRLMAAPALGGTRETVPSHIWMHETELAASRELRVGESLAGERIHAKLRAAYHAGEPMWMAASAAVQMARGARVAALESHDGLNTVRAAVAS